MNIEESAVREELQDQLAADPEGMIDLTKLWLAAGRPRGRSPLKWATWLSLAQLRKRGWTEALVAQFLPDCQSTMTNPHYKTGPRIKLYPVARVAVIEA